MHRDRRHLRNTVRPARRGLAAILLLALLAGWFPLAAVTGGFMCRLACCAGGALHESGSCVGGACHADLISRAKLAHLDRRETTRKSEEICGFQGPIARQTGVHLPITIIAFGQNADSHSSTANSETATHEDGISSLVMSQPCKLDCSSGTFTKTNQRRPREALALSFASLARPLSGKYLLHSESTHAYKRDALRWQTSPRAPPSLPV